MEQGYLTTLLFVANCLISFGNSFGYDLTWSIRNFILQPRTSDCSVCLGFSTFELNFMSGFAFWTTLPVTCICARILRQFGLQRVLIGLSFVSVFGSVLRFLATSAVISHSVIFYVLFVAECLVSWSQGGFLVVRNYVAIRYLWRSYVPVLIISMISSICGSLLAVWCMNSYTNDFGIHAAYGIGAGLAGIGPICAAVMVWALNHGVEEGGSNAVCVFTAQVQCASFIDFKKLHFLLLGAIFGVYHGYLVDSAHLYIHLFEIEPPRIAAFVGFSHFLRINARRIVTSIFGVGFFSSSFGVTLESCTNNVIVILIILVHQCHPIIPLIYHVCSKPRDSTFNISRMAAQFPFVKVFRNFRQYSYLAIFFAFIASTGSTFTYSFRPWQSSIVVWVIAFIVYIAAAAVVGVISLALWFAESIEIQTLALSTPQERNEEVADTNRGIEEGNEVAEDEMGESEDAGPDIRERGVRSSTE